MRIMHLAIKSLIPLVALMAAMAVPSMASAAYWGDDGGEPLGGSYESEDVVAAEISGSIIATSTGTGSAWGSVTCDVTGEIELSNDWQDPSTNATQRIVSLAPVSSVATSCTGATQPSPCTLSNAVFSGLPWAGKTEESSFFSGVLVTATFKNGSDPTCSTNGPTFSTGNVWNNVTPIKDGGHCLLGFDLDGSTFSGGPGASPYAAIVSGQLDVDHDSFQGPPVGACVTLVG